MAGRHFTFWIAGNDDDTGEEYNLAAMVAVTDEYVTYTARSVDRSRVQRIQRPASEARFFLEMMETVEAVCRPEAERETA